MRHGAVLSWTPACTFLKPTFFAEVMMFVFSAFTKMMQIMMGKLKELAETSSGLGSGV